MRILFTSNPLAGHVLPLLPLLRAAQRAGHEVVLATGASLGPELQRRGIAGWPVGPEFRDAVAAGPVLYPRPAADRAEQLRRDASVFFARPSIARARALVPQARAWRPHLVVHELYEFAGWEAAAAVGAVDVVHGLGTHIPGLDQHATQIFGELAEALHAPDRSDRFGTVPYLDPVPPRLHTHSAPFADVRPVRPEIGEVPPGAQLPAGLLRGLPYERSVYLTLGTVTNRPELVSETLVALQELPVNVLVTAGPDADPASFGPRPANVVVTSFVPQALLLPHVSAVVSHGGAGTMLGALAAGLPQVCLPQGADQFANADGVHASGAGVTLRPDQASAGAVQAAVRSVLDDPRFARVAADVRDEIARMPAADQVLDALTVLAGERVPA